MKMKIIFILMLVLGIMLLNGSVSADITIDNKIISCGGSQLSAGSFTLNSSIGQLCATVAERGDSTLSIDDGFLGYMKDSASRFFEWYFPDGNTNANNDLYLLIVNPCNATNNIRITFINEGNTERSIISVFPQSRRTIYVNNLISNSIVSTKVETTSRLPFIAEMSQYWDAGGVRWTGGFSTLGATETATAWYIAEGCTNPPYETHIKIMNPSDSLTAFVTISFSTPGGETISEEVIIPPLITETIFANSVLTDEFGTTVTSDNPVVVQSTMSWTANGQERWGGHTVMGSPHKSTSIFFAEGYTGGDFREWLCIFNPDETSTAEGTVTYAKIDGTTEVQDISVGPQTRLTVSANDTVLSQPSSIKIQITNNVEIVAARSMYSNSDWINLSSGHSTAGHLSAGTTWYIAELFTGGTFDAWLLMYNTSTETTAQVRLTFYKNNGEIVTRTAQIDPDSRYTIKVDNIIDGEPVSVRAKSINNVPIVIEHSMYWNSDNLIWVGGSNSIGALYYD